MVPIEEPPGPRTRSRSASRRSAEAAGRQPLPDARTRRDVDADAERGPVDPRYEDCGSRRTIRSSSRISRRSTWTSTTRGVAPAPPQRRLGESASWTSKSASKEIEARYEQVQAEMSTLEAATDPDRLRTLGQQFAELEQIVRPVPRVPGGVRRGRRGAWSSPTPRPTTRWRAFLRGGGRRPRAGGAAPGPARAAARPEGPQRGQGRDPRDPRRRRRPGGGAVGRRPVRDVPAPRRAAPLEDRGARVLAGDLGGFKEVVAGDPRARRVRPAEARGGRPSGPARAGDRVAGPDPHVHRDRRRDARGRGGRGRDPARGPRDRRLPLERPRRAVGEHDRLGGADHAQAHRDQGRGAGGAIAAAEPREGDALPARAPVPEALDEAQAKEAAARRAQVGTGERSEKIRTYNFPEGRVTDHRIKHTSHQLQDVLAGGDELDGFTERCSPPSGRRSSPSGRRVDPPCRGVASD